LSLIRYASILPANGPLGLFLLMFLSSALVVFSIDFTITRSRGVIGEFACLSGLKLSIAEMILLATAGRLLISTAMQFMVASMRIGSLYKQSVFPPLRSLRFLLTLYFVERHPAVGPANPKLLPPIAAKKEKRGFLGRGRLRSHFVQVAAYMSAPFASSWAGCSRTLGSEITPGVCTCTILCRSLMQHTRTPIGAVSMRFSILDLMATMFCHVAASSGRDILHSEISEQFSVRLQTAAGQLYMAQVLGGLRR
jgi:hypothetical protein